MGDSLHSSGSTKNPSMRIVNNRKNASNGCIVASDSKSLSPKSFRHAASLDSHKMGRAAAGHVALFLVKLAALEMVRRFSTARRSFVWRGLQALQVLSYPPVKWIQKWPLFGGLVKGAQSLSRPLLVLSIATAFSGPSDCGNEMSTAIGASDDSNDCHASSEANPEPPLIQSTSDTSEALQGSSDEDWLLKLHKELENQEISLPERINDNEIRRFYVAANGDFSCLLSLIKKTIRWRETYRILTELELETWSKVVFWHGVDVKGCPCLFIRLGVACVGLAPPDRPRFAQAVVSQIEHGILHLLDSGDADITVVVDCDRINPLRIPMQMLRSCCSILQNNFPHRLSCLFVIRLPPVARVIAQTLIQASYLFFLHAVLKPATRERVKFEGQFYERVLTEYLQTIPSFLGGNCKCLRCSNISNSNTPHLLINDETCALEPNYSTDDSDDLPSPSPTFDTGHMDVNYDQVLRTAIISILMVWLFIVLLAGVADPESRACWSWSSQDKH
ncbi:CRAL-TRIO lipid binding domain [Dillenia turbinata]|uniref:CRAL-TRIO lipid binding domain n=1 Tax=Dillenia turbinata TaxID=194707 RepID=A0AAN8VXB2_9MAGN